MKLRGRVKKGFFFWRIPPALEKLREYPAEITQNVLIRDHESVALLNTYVDVWADPCKALSDPYDENLHLSVGSRPAVTPKEAFRIAAILEMGKRVLDTVSTSMEIGGDSLANSQTRMYPLTLSVLPRTR